MPYIFKDPIKFDKKVDPRKLQFGSKIDKNGGERHEFFIVKEVVSPELVRLNNGLTVRLLGVKQNLAKNGRATQFLNDKVKGAKVFLKYDSKKHDEKNNLLCYLYLQNKTFVNAHLVKNNLVDVDTAFDYKYRSKFLNLCKI